VRRPSRTERRNKIQYYILAAISRCNSCCNAWNVQLLYRSMRTCHTHSHFPCPKLLLPVGVLLSYSVLLVRISYTWISASWMILMLSNIWKWTHVLFVNTPCSHVHNFFATGVSSGLATRNTLIWLSPGEVGVICYTGMDLLLISFSYNNTWFFSRVLNVTSCIYTHLCVHV
jgi:hypothetical protein